jgi:hypothetical protein
VATPIQLLINHAEVSDDMEWGIGTEENLGGIGPATLIVQDRTNSYEPEAHWDVQVIVRSTGFVLYRGEIISQPIDLTLGLGFRTWKMQCSDYNGQLPQRLVGALDGRTWMDTSGLGIFVNIDPFNSTLDTDKLTVQRWLDHYIRVDGTALETDTFVQQYLTDLPSKSWYYSRLQTVLEELAAYVVNNLQFWIDPDLFFHWVTIPAWYDLAGGGLDAEIDSADSGSALLLPEGTVAGLAFAPFEVVDIDADPDVNKIGFHSLDITLDGKEMPEQIYVRGSTGYVYNAPALDPTAETKVTVHDPTPGAADRYELTFLATTKLWHVDGTGYVSISYDTTGAGGPFEVKWVKVPWNDARNKGGNYWKLLTGPNTGKLVDDNTNSLNGYGSIRVQKVTTPLGLPKIGVGGSGWVGEAVQDPNKRQAYLELPISSDQATRDAMGGMALYRGSFPTLRGQFRCTGFDGWRVGQLVKITDSRLPASLNGKYYVIQRVAAKLVATLDVRQYTIDFGDGPTSRFSGQRPPGNVAWPGPSNTIFISVFDLSPGPNSSQRVSAQMVNASGEPWAVEGKTVNWSLECYNNLGVLQTGQGTLNPEVSVTNGHGKAYTTFTTGPGEDLVYYIFADVKAT